VLVTWIIFRFVGVQLEDLRAIDLGEWRPDLPLLIASCVLLLMGYFVSASVWGLMVHDLGGPRLRFGTCIRIFMIANLGRYLPGKVWQIVGLATLARQRGVPAAVATGAAAVGQGMALLGATLVGTTAFVSGEAELRVMGFAMLSLAVVGVGAVSLPRVLRAAMSLWFRLTRQELPKDWTPRPGLVFRWLALYTANWVLYAFAFWVLLRSFGLPGTLIETAPAFAAAYVAGYLVLFSPAGIGVRESFLTMLLAPIMGQGSAFTLAVVGRLWTTAVEVVPAAGFWVRHLHLGSTGGDS